jgi:serine/threonine protein kinase/WD40 repeat protein
MLSTKILSVVSREESIFGRALEFSSAEAQKAFVEGACADDQELSGRIRKLLAASEGADGSSFLDEATADLEAPVREGEGSIIGRYKLLQKIGEGGFGVVYMAEQKEPVRRRVALKIIKLGMDTKQVVGRFEAERQALALMDHPNIAKVLDAGSTESGRPYFVMDLVRGVPLMQFCDEQKLTTRQRLGVFIDICSTIEHAHQKGIINRDLKPSNVIVTSDNDQPMPKVIDFGIAKATQHDLTDKTLFTRYEDFVGTPAYMSPEQAQFTGLDVDTRTDIYSLGVMLYELLVGSAPFDGKELMSAGVDELRRRIREDEPRRPSTHVNTMENVEVTRIAGSRRTDPGRLGKTLRGELDWIILKAMDKDRQRRYSTASELALDMRRFLVGDPVAACPPSTVYRARKFVRKHRFPFAIAAAFVAALAIGAVGATWQAIEASLASIKEREAREEATSQLWNSYVHQAKLQRQSRTVGQHFGTLETVRKAAAIKPSMELRNEAIAAMALPDLRLVEPLGIDREAGFPVAVDSRGKLSAKSDSSTLVHLFSRQSGKKLFSLPAHGGQIYYLQFSPDGRFLGVVFRDPETRKETLKLWDLNDRSVLLTESDVEWRTDYDPETTRISVLKRPDLVEIFGLETGELLQEIPVTHRPHRAVFSPDGTQIAITSPLAPTVTIFDIETGEEVASFNQKDRIYGVCWAPGGNQIVCSTNNFNVILHDIPSGIQRMEYHGHLAQVVSLEVPGRGNHLFTAGWDGYSRIWHLQSGEKLFEIRGNFSTITKDGRKVIVAAESPNAGVWEFTEGSPCFSRFHLDGMPSDKVVSLAFSPDGRWLAGGGGRGFALWDLNTGEDLAFAEHASIRSILFVGDDSMSIEASGANGMHRWQIRPTLNERGQGGYQLEYVEELVHADINKHI